MTTPKTTKIAEWDIDSWESYFLDDKLPPSFRLAVVKNLLADQREELLDLVEKEVVGEDEYSAMINGVPAQDMHDDYQNQLRRQQRQKLLALRKEGGEKV